MIRPSAELGDRHQVALWRLAAVAQYLYDTMAGDGDSDRGSPLPSLATESLREAQRLIDVAIKDGQRTRRSCIAGQVELCEMWKDEPDTSCVDS